MATLRFNATTLDDSTPIVTFAGTDEVGEGIVHSHPSGQLIGCARGIMSVSTDAGTWVVPARHAIWVPPHHAHFGRSHGPITGWSLYLAESRCVGLQQKPCTLAVAPFLWEAVLRSAEWSKAPLDAAQLRIAQVIIDEIGRHQPQPLHLPLPRDARLLRIAKALLQEPADRRGIEGWANWAGLSTRTLSRRFVMETNLTFTHWTQRCRLLCALQMLAEGVSITTIAIDLGYSNLSAFTHVFKRNFGVTPSAYRLSSP